MGVVYEGHDEGLGRRVAVKILHRDLVTNKDIVQRFHREAQIAHQLDHPGIVRVVLFGQLSDGNLYLVLEFLEGPTLAEAIESERRMAPARAVKIVATLADAIGYAHARGIVHRDLKPENIILTRRDQEHDFPKILDFGIAKTLIGTGSFVTQSGLIFGTARYISPEGASGEPVDQRGDVYSLGVIAYELLCGHTPFECEEPMQLLLKHMHEPPPPMRQWAPQLVLHPALENLVMRCLVKNPEGRYDDGNALARALRDAASAGGIDVRSIVPTTSMASLPLSAIGVAPTPAVGIASETLAPPERVERGSSSDSAKQSAPVSAVESSGVSRVRTVSLVERAEARATAPTLSAPVALHLPQRMELPVITASAAMAQSPTPPVLSSPVVVPAAVSHVRPDVNDDSSADADEFPVLPRPPGAGRTLMVILASVLVTMILATAAAWAFRLFPSQRRSDEIAILLRRANEALRLGRYVHAASGADVEDLTDAVLALDPHNARAAQLRRAAAMRLKADSDAERTAGHPERAVSLLQDALRLIDDATLREELAATQREIEVRRTPPPAPVRPTPRPTPRPRVEVPRDPTLDHPAQPVVPLHPPVVPAQPPTQAQSRTVRPRRDPGVVVQSPPSDPNQIIVPPSTPPPRVPVFGDPPPEGDDETHVGAF
jgi:serine/threonine-protein kinase